MNSIKSTINPVKHIFSIIMLTIFIIADYIVPFVKKDVLVESISVKTINSPTYIQKYYYLWNGSALIYTNPNFTLNTSLFNYLATRHTDFAMYNSIFSFLFIINNYFVPLIIIFLILVLIFELKNSKRKLNSQIQSALILIIFVTTITFYTIFFGLFVIIPNSLSFYKNSFILRYDTLQLLMIGWTALFVDLVVNLPDLGRVFYKLKRINYRKLLGKKSIQSIILFMSFFVLDFLLPILKIVDIATNPLILYWDGTFAKYTNRVVYINPINLNNKYYPSNLKLLGALFALLTYGSLLIIPFFVLFLIINPISEAIGIPNRLLSKGFYKINPNKVYLLLFIGLLIISIGQYILFFIIYSSFSKSIFTFYGQAYLKLDLFTLVLFIIGWISLALGYKNYYGRQSI